MSLKGVIFDVDGVLLDTMHVWTDAGARYLQSLGVKAEAGLGDKLFTMTVDMGAVYVKERYALAQSAEEITRGINGVVAGYYADEAAFKPGARQLLERLKTEGIPMTIASSTTEDYIRTAFDRLGYTGYFAEILSCVQWKTSKAEPKIFFEAMKIMGTKPSESWLFEDGLYSVKTAKTAGLKTVGVYDPVSEKEQAELSQTVDIYVRTLEELDFDRLLGVPSLER